MHIRFGLTYKPWDRFGSAVKYNRTGETSISDLRHSAVLVCSTIVFHTPGPALSGHGFPTSGWPREGRGLTGGGAHFGRFGIRAHFGKFPKYALLPILTKHALLPKFPKCALLPICPAGPGGEHHEFDSDREASRPRRRTIFPHTH